MVVVAIMGVIMVVLGKAVLVWGMVLMEVKVVMVVTMADGCDDGGGVIAVMIMMVVVSLVTAGVHRW